MHTTGRPGVFSGVYVTSSMQFAISHRRRERFRPVRLVVLTLRVFAPHFRFRFPQKLRRTAPESLPCDPCSTSLLPALSAPPSPGPASQRKPNSRRPPLRRPLLQALLPSLPLHRLRLRRSLLCLCLRFPPGPPRSSRFRRRLQKLRSSSSTPPPANTVPEPDCLSTPRPQCAHSASFATPKAHPPVGGS